MKNFVLFLTLVERIKTIELTDLTGIGNFLNEKKSEIELLILGFLFFYF